MRLADKRVGWANWRIYMLEVIAKVLVQRRLGLYI